VCRRLYRAMSDRLRARVRSGQVWSHACASYGVCAACGGTGVRLKEAKLQEPYMVSQTIHSCPVCGGKKYAYVNCPEPTRQRQRARVLVELQPGLNDHATMRFANAGDESLHQHQPRQFGDLQLVLKLRSTDEARSLSLHDFDLVKDIRMNAQMALEVNQRSHREKSLASVAVVLGDVTMVVYHRDSKSSSSTWMAAMFSSTGQGN